MKIPFEVHERREWIHSPRGDLFVCVSTHEEEGNAGVVICPPLFAEFVRNYRKEVVLARTLAANGIATVRFHYAGTGHSFGCFDDVTLEELVDDASRATEVLEQRLGCTKLAFVGTRLGAYVAAGAARGKRARAVAFWDPPESASSYFRELFRALLIHRIRLSGTDAMPTRENLLSTLRLCGSVDVFGYVLGRQLYESTESVSLQDVALGLDMPLFIAQLGLVDTLRKDYADISSTRHQGGRTTTTTLAAVEEGWWFAGDAWDVGTASYAGLVNATVEWLDATLRPPNENE